jgi:membrane-anchored mycosin MYCP
VSNGLRLLAVAAAACLVVTTGSPAAAVPGPRSDEWWFSAWGIQGHVWPKTMGTGVTVGLLDSGVHASAPELSGAILRGGDTAGRQSDGRHDFDNLKDGHGTAMAALIVGQGGGPTGFVGIAPKAKILPVHVVAQTLDVTGDKPIADGIRFAVDHGAKIVNMSLGEDSQGDSGHCTDNLQDAIAYAIRRNVVLVASSGDSGDGLNTSEAPASCPGVLAVGAIDSMLHPWKSTQRQSYVAVAAPGYDVGFLGRSGKYYPNGWGTSSASAFTAGAAALIRSRNPKMSARTVVQRLIATAHQMGPSRRNNQTGYGAIQISSAIDPQRFPVPANALNPVYDAFDKWQASQRAVPPPPISRPDGTSHARAVKTGHHASWTPLVIIGSAVGVLVIAVFGVIILVTRRRRSRQNRVTAAARALYGNKSADPPYEPS